MTIKPTTIAMNVDGLTIQFEGQMAVCDQCGHEATSQDCQQYNGRQFRAEINKPRLLNPKAALHARTTLHLSADYTARCLDIPLAVFTAIETGACAVTPSQLKALATIYLVEPDELINPDFTEPGTYRREVDDLRRYVRRSTKA